MINAWVLCAPIHYAGARSIINAHVGIKSVDQLTIKQVGEAIALIQSKIDTASQSPDATPLAIAQHSNPFIAPQIDQELRQVRALVDDALCRAKHFEAVA